MKLFIILIDLFEMPVSGCTCFNTLYGLLAVSVAMNTLMEPAGKACAETQQYRAEWLRIEVVLFWLCFVFFSWPIIALRCCSKESHDYILSKKEDSDDDD